MNFHSLVAHFFLILNTIPFSGCIIHLLNVGLSLILVVSKFGQLEIKLRYKINFVFPLSLSDPSQFFKKSSGFTLATLATSHYLYYCNDQILPHGISSLAKSSIELPSLL